MTGDLTFSGEQVSSQLYGQYYDGTRELGDPALLLDTSDEPSGTTDFVVTLLPPPDATKLRLASTVHLLDGTATYTANEISHRLPGSSTQRSTYYLAGKAIATWVKVYSAGGDSNDLYYFHSDHLGSASVMSDDNGAVVANSTARYLPFGDWRTEPTVGLTELGYTGHHQNNFQGNDLGLIYMNARFYVGGVYRFATADTIIPDPANPQSYNRYSYVNNSPMRFTDPSGHCAEIGAEECWSYLESQFCADGLCDDWRRWIIVDPETSIWTIEELKRVRSALLYAKEGISSLGGDWQSYIGSETRFRRHNEPNLRNWLGFTTSGIGKYYEPYFWQGSSGSVIELANNMFSYADNLAELFILHEIGHAIAFNTGADIEWAEANSERIYFCLGEACTSEPGLVSEGYYWRKRGRGRKEGWSDAFSMWAYERGTGNYVFDGPQSMTQLTVEFDPGSGSFDHGVVNSLYDSVETVLTP